MNRRIRGSTIALAVLMLLFMIGWGIGVAQETEDVISQEINIDDIENYWKKYKSVRPSEPEKVPTAIEIDTPMLRSPTADLLVRTMPSSFNIEGEVKAYAWPGRNLPIWRNVTEGIAPYTYEWDFAPYLLELKRRIRRNIFPPIAFTRLGMISGVTLLRFKIYPDGQLRDLKILGYEGDRSLMETSQTAVEISAPFPDLPSDFPEPYLEVTGKFLYLIKPIKKRGE